ncbi:MAG: hypothetical protein ABI416_11565 [Ginsengibacter sp.]
MKNNTKKVMILLVSVFFVSCQSNKKMLNTGTIAENTTMKSEFISGSVNEIQKGKDGYTAKITSAEGQLYYATISHSNLKNPAQYKTLQIGDTIKVKGDAWKMENENHITVRELQ